MNKLAFLAIFLVSAAFASHTYTVDINRDGLSYVTLSLEGQENASVPLPDDAMDVRIVGGSYSMENGIAIVQTGKSGLASFSYTTNLFTTKTQSGWKLSFSAPEGAIVNVYMPPYATLDNIFPQQTSVSSDGSRAVVGFSDPGSVTVFYSLGEPPAQQADQTPLYMLAGAVLLAAAIIAGSVVLGGRPHPATPQPSAPHAAAPPHAPAPAAAPPAPAEKQPTLDMTAGKKEMMETFNSNDLKIADFLLSSGGRCRRNELERKTGISKSSLAMALNRLEKRKIVELDRTSTTHFVKLSDYFLRL
jgi:uncharacterized membrane protein